MLFDADQYPSTEAAAKLIVYILRPGQASEPGSALSRLVQLARLLEQYFHPSNNGSCALLAGL